MKIGIITHHDVHNHGAQLQLNALIKVFASLGHSAKALSYTKNFDFLDENASNKYNITLKSIPYYTNYIFKKGMKKTLFNIKKKSILEEFRNHNQLVGGYYSKENNLDCVFVGSDEVFSIEPGLNTFFWGMGVPTQNIFSYAGCFGPTTPAFIKEKYAEEFITAGISRFNRISVRDKNSKGIVYDLTKKEVPIVCDPVILYGYKNEIKEIKKPDREKYIVVYAYDNNMNDKEEVKKIKAFAKSKNLKIISAGFYHNWCDESINVTPTELINYIKYAEYVVTDTFHGSVISIIMNTPFTTKIRGNRNKLGYLLEEYDLLSRETVDFSDLDRMFNDQIDFQHVNSNIADKRKKSKAYIKNCLEEATLNNVGK